jgi:hypothetical protein
MSSKPGTPVVILVVSIAGSSGGGVDGVSSLIMNVSFFVAGRLRERELWTTARRVSRFGRAWPLDRRVFVTLDVDRLTAAFHTAFGVGRDVQHFLRPVPLVWSDQLGWLRCRSQPVDGLIRALVF